MLPTLVAYCHLRSPSKTFLMGVWWLDILDPTDQEIDALTEEFRIHARTSVAIKTRRALEKVEVFQHYYFGSFRSFYLEEKAGLSHITPTSVFTLVLGKGLLSFAFGPSLHAAAVQKQLWRLNDPGFPCSDWICCALL